MNAKVITLKTSSSDVRWFLVSLAPSFAGEIIPDVYTCKVKGTVDQLENLLEAFESNRKTRLNRSLRRFASSIEKAIFSN